MIGTYVRFLSCPAVARNFLESFHRKSKKSHSLPFQMQMGMYIQHTHPVTSVTMSNRVALPAM